MMMGQALNRLSTLDKVENRSYSSWEAVLERCGLACLWAIYIHALLSLG